LMAREHKMKRILVSALENGRKFLARGHER
jgi:hypothetical protein